jgi:hypothetical protein
LVSLASLDDARTPRGSAADKGELNRSFVGILVVSLGTPQSVGVQ